MRNSFGSNLGMCPAARARKGAVMRQGGHDHKAGRAGACTPRRQDSLVPAFHSPVMLSFLWFILVLFSPATQSSAVAAVSWWLNMENGTNGAQLTTNILN